MDETQYRIAKKDFETIVRILWTGGYDSSYRVVQLSRYNVTIQPYYLSDNRKSEVNELLAIESITSDIKKHPETKCTILPLVKYNVEDIEPDEEITKAYQRLYLKTKIGSQYDWLARFVKRIPGLELCVEKAETSKEYNCIIKLGGGIRRVIDDEISYWILDKTKSDADVIKIFGYFRFPILQIDKLEMKDEYMKLGFIETMHKTWFCHTPINNEPCGICNPCKSVIEGGLSFRLGNKAMKRYRIEKCFSKFKLYKYMKAINRRIRTLWNI